MEVNILNEREQVYRSSDAPKPIKKITELTEREVVYYKSSDPKADCDNFVDMYEEDYIVEEDIGINIPNVAKCPSKCNSQSNGIETDPVFSASPAAQITEENIEEWNTVSLQVELNKNNITVLDKNIEALSLSTQKIIDGRTVISKAKEATSAEKDSDGNVIKTTYAKQKDYNYTLGTALATSELSKYLNISHNYNKTLAIPYATENNGGAMSAEDKSKIDNVNINSPIAYAVYDGTSADVVVTTTTGYFPTELITGARVTIKITGNIGLIKTLNVNGTGVKNVYYSGNSMTSGMIDRYNVYDFIFDGTYYRILGVDTDTNTHYNTKIVAGASATSKTNDNAENGNVYLNVIENSTVRSSNNIVGEGDISVRSDATGKIIIESRVEGIDVTDLFSGGGSGLQGNISDLITKPLYTKDSNGNLTYPVTFYPKGDSDDNIDVTLGYLYREHVTQVSGNISTKKYIASIRQNGSYIVCDAVDSRTSTL